MTAAAAPPASRGLTRADFRPIATGGFGDPHNGYPHSATWFRNHFYVSTTRDNLVLVKLRYGFEIPLAAWPVRVPQDVWDLDLRAQIWRYDPVAQDWTRVFLSPLAKAADGAEIPLTIAFRAMVVFEGRSDPGPAIYAPTLSPGRLQADSGSLLMRSLDGEHFAPVGEIGGNLALGKFRGFRALQAFKGRLFTAPVMGVAAGTPNVAGVALIMASDDPARGGWEVVNTPNFGDPTNIGIFEMGVANGFLYAGTVNLAQGFQVWKTDGEGRAPYRWTRVISRGAFRGRLNQGTVGMAAFGNHLYVGGAIQNGGYDRANNIGPAAAELIRIAPDDSWDLIAGDPRNTPDGLKAPLSGFGAGFGNPFAGYFWRLAEHDGWLYLGTFDSSVLLWWHPGTNMPAYIRNVFDVGTMEHLLQRFGGFDLWRSRDGVRWTPVTNNGMGNRFNYGLRTMVSTPYGFFVGAANPFGPEIAVRRAGGWVYEPNPAGGAEVWLGTTAHADRPEAPEAPAVEIRDTIRGTGGRKHDAAICETLIAEYYGGSEFRHFGCWRGDVSDSRAACEHLVEELLSFVPEKSGTIVDVGCGRGGTTAHLRRYYAPGTVTGVTADKQTLRTCRRLVPDARFLVGVPRLALPDATAETVLCAEGIAALRDKAAALREMLRVLRPGGRLVLADVLFAGEDADDGAVAPADAVAYRALLERLGFTDVHVEDATYECWTKHNFNRTVHFGMKMLSKQVDPQLLAPLLAALPGGGRSVIGYLLIAARRPVSAADADRRSGA